MSTLEVLIFLIYRTLNLLLLGFHVSLSRLINGDQTRCHQMYQATNKRAVGPMKASNGISFVERVFWNSIGQLLSSADPLPV